MISDSGFNHAVLDHRSRSISPESWQEIPGGNISILQGEFIGLILALVSLKDSLLSYQPPQHRLMASGLQLLLESESSVTCTPH